MSGHQKQPRKRIYPQGLCLGWTGEVDLEEYREEFINELPHLAQFFDEISKLVGVYAAKLKRWEHDPAPGARKENINRKIEQTYDLLHDLEVIAPRAVRRIPDLNSTLDLLIAELEQERKSIEPEIKKGARTNEANIWFEDQVIYIVHQVNGNRKDLAKILKLAMKAIPPKPGKRDDEPCRERATDDDACRKRAEKAWKRMPLREYAV